MAAVRNRFHHENGFQPNGGCAHPFPTARGPRASVPNPPGGRTAVSTARGLRVAPPPPPPPGLLSVQEPFLTPPYDVLTHSGGWHAQGRRLSVELEPRVTRLPQANKETPPAAPRTTQRPTICRLPMCARCVPSFAAGTLPNERCEPAHSPTAVQRQQAAELERARQQGPPAGTAAAWLWAAQGRCCAAPPTAQDHCVTTRATMPIIT